MAMATRNEGSKVNSNINVTPMVDVMLVLLIIFMVITPMLNNKVNVDLPKTDSATVMEDANKEDAVTIAVTRDGTTFLGGDKVSLDDLGPKISAKLENKTNKQVFMRADARANYGKVMDAVDGVRAAGVSQLGLLTEKREQAEPVTTKK
ncbi:ExbD/TolR family protein [Edaphobacter modestus]|uniref:Outer membrane transport energization protein ExbD n=1 Tax=Edaphobacter modestus TaxID=388466 RepID=A0A4Q7YUH3_9BACT|nr:biopolymer transporter ExbD [Edaphobacter modestus]RZU41512.1 outer membrane transport energization protein ExbD [Edaphobacter modestus]